MALSLQVSVRRYVPPFVLGFLVAAWMPSAMLAFSTRPLSFEPGVCSPPAVQQIRLRGSGSAVQSCEVYHGAVRRYSRGRLVVEEDWDCGHLLRSRWP